MKKIFIYFLLLLVCVLPLTSCATGSAEAPSSSSDTTAASGDGSGSRKSVVPAEDEDENEVDTTVIPAMTIAEDGKHTLTGTIDGQVLVTAENVTLILDGVKINSPDGPAILGDDGNGSDAEQTLTIELHGESSATAGTKHGVQGKDNLSVGGDGTLNITAEKDGLHAGDTLSIRSGTVNVLQSYEGMEAPYINISGGKTTVRASDDGVNAATDDEGVTPGLKITGGTLTVYAGSDGLDSNGTLDISAGTVAIFINAPRDGLPFDPDRISDISPALIVSSPVTAGTELKILTSGGEVKWTGKTEADATSFALVVPGLSNGESYTVSANGKSLSTVTATTTVQGMGGGMGGGKGGMGGTPPDGTFGGRRDDRQTAPLPDTGAASGTGT